MNVSEIDISLAREEKNLSHQCLFGGHIMLLLFQAGLYHDQRNYTSLTKTKAPPSLSTSTYQPRVSRSSL